MKARLASEYTVDLIQNHIEKLKNSKPVTSL